MPETSIPPLEGDVKPERKPRPEPRPRPVAVAEPQAKRRGVKPSKMRYRLKRAALVEASGVVERLAEYWPTIFPLSGPVRPLRVGIAEAVVEYLISTGIPRSIARAAIAAWKARRWREYLEALAAGGDRIDIDGSAYGQVDRKDRRRAEKRLLKAA